MLCRIAGDVIEYPCEKTLKEARQICRQSQRYRQEIKEPKGHPKEEKSSVPTQLFVEPNIVSYTSRYIELILERLRLASRNIFDNETERLILTMWMNVRSAAEVLEYEDVGTIIYGRRKGLKCSVGRQVELDKSCISSIPSGYAYCLTPVTIVSRDKTCWRFTLSFEDPMGGLRHCEYPERKFSNESQLERLRQCFKPRGSLPHAFSWDEIDETLVDIYINPYYDRLDESMW